ncbi:MAG: GTP-dependent dephospho-CoA kinase family protein [Halodesulfurarchaeum sp.]|nr:GTP-dependent dephospho-CoA kinase family protein [Halodesulfurarchaeum sp.]
MPTVVARLPAAEREAFKEPLGDVYESTEPLLADRGAPIVAVGDVVLAHLGRAGVTPTLSIVDGRTERGPVEADVLADRPEAATEFTVENPAGTIMAELVEAIEAGFADSRPMRIIVTGEEDLAVLPAILLAPAGTTVVYGQPGEGMVAVEVDAELRARVGSLLDRMDRDSAFWDSIA